MSDPYLPGCIVTVTSTAVDGAVVRWYPSLDRAERGDPIISASRNGVVFHEPEHVTGTWRYYAYQAHIRLSQRGADMSALATHRRRSPMDPLEATHRHELAKCPACHGAGIYDEYGTGDEPCELCSRRGYEPVGGILS